MHQFEHLVRKLADVFLERLVCEWPTSPISFVAAEREKREYRRLADAHLNPRSLSTLPLSHPYSPLASPPFFSFTSFFNSGLFSPTMRATSSKEARWPIRR